MYTVPLIIPHPFGGERFQARVGVGEERFESGAEMVQAAVGRIPEAVLGTSAPAQPMPFALSTLLRQQCFPPAEIRLSIGIKRFYHAFRHHITQDMAWFYKKIAGIHIAIVLNNQVIPAFLKQGAFRRIKLGIGEKQ